MSSQPSLPIPRRLKQVASSDPEVRAWASAAQEVVEALHDELAVARARAEDAERRLREVPSAATIAGPGGSGGSADVAEVGSAAAQAQVRFEAATEAAMSVLTEVRAILRSSREALPNPPTQMPESPTADGLASFE